MFEWVDKAIAEAHSDSDSTNPDWDWYDLSKYGVTDEEGQPPEESKDTEEGGFWSNLWDAMTDTEGEDGPEEVSPDTDEPAGADTVAGTSQASPAPAPFVAPPAAPGEVATAAASPPESSPSVVGVRPLWLVAAAVAVLIFWPKG